jgi:hypothetical protein
LNLTLDLEIQQHLASLKHVINIIIWIRDRVLQRLTDRLPDRRRVYGGASPTASLTAAGSTPRARSSAPISTAVEVLPTLSLLHIVGCHLNFVSCVVHLKIVHKY